MLSRKLKRINITSKIVSGVLKEEGWNLNLPVDSLAVPLLDGVLGSVGQSDQEIVSATEAQQVRRGGRRGR